MLLDLRDLTHEFSDLLQEICQWLHLLSRGDIASAQDRLVVHPCQLLNNSGYCLGIRFGVGSLKGYLLGCQSGEFVLIILDLGQLDLYRRRKKNENTSMNTTVVIRGT